MEQCLMWRLNTLVVLMISCLSTAALANPNSPGMTCQKPDFTIFASSYVNVSVCVVDSSIPRSRAGDLIILVERQNWPGTINVSATCAVSIPLTPNTIQILPFDFKVANVPLTLEAGRNTTYYTIEHHMAENFRDDWKNQGENRCTWTAAPG